MHPASSFRRGRSRPARTQAISSASSPAATSSPLPERDKKAPFPWERTWAIQRSSRESHAAAHTKGAANGAAPGSSVKKEPAKARYSKAVPGAAMRKLAKGSSRGNPPNTASCTGKVPSKAAAVAARETAAGFHRAKARPCRRLPRKACSKGR